MKAFQIVGSTADSDTYFSEHIIKDILALNDAEVSFDLSVHFEVDYLEHLHKMKFSYGREFQFHRSFHYILLNGSYFGDVKTLRQLAEADCAMDPEEIPNPILIGKRQAEDSARLLGDRKAAFIEFSSAWHTDHLGKLVIELFTDLCPKACENFTKLCTGENGVDGGTCAKLHYLNSPIHRLVAGGWLQGGDIIDGSGAHSIAATGDDGKVQDECFTVDFGSRLGGMVGFSKSSPHSNGSQFFVTFGPCEWMNEKFVGIGRVIQGYEVLKMLEQAPTKNQKPVVPILISNCGSWLGR